MKRLLIAMLAVSLLPLAVRADYIPLPVKWSQAPVDPQGMLSYSDCTAPAGQVSADDFVCDDEEPIVAVRWWGAYDDPDFYWSDPPLIYGGLFHISFHLSMGEHPTGLPVSDPIVVYEVQASGVQVYSEWPMYNYIVYQYEAYLPEAFDQWYSSHEVAASLGANIGELFIDICSPTRQEWAWSSVDAPGPIGNWMAFTGEGAGHSGPWSSGYVNMAFELMVPEPATMALVGLGLAGLVARRRRR